MTGNHSAVLAPPARPGAVRRAFLAPVPPPADLPYRGDMASSPVFVRPATSADVTTLAAVLARAFYDDPPLTWLLPDPATRLGRVTRMFATVIGIESLRYGGVDVACDGEKILGGAIWLPPGHRRAGFREQIQAVPNHVRTLASALGRAARYGLALEGAHPKEPHWYLKAIGIDPAWQGLGLASLLLRSRLNRCDQDGQPAYLEAGKPDGVPMYEHFGFRRIGNLGMPEGAPPTTAMWRAPATWRPSAPAPAPMSARCASSAPRRTRAGGSLAGTDGWQVAGLTPSVSAR
jgi:ribosomal protein S18 acetylase RimI-like enzyme